MLTYHYLHVKGKGDYKSRCQSELSILMWSSKQADQVRDQIEKEGLRSKVGPEVILLDTGLSQTLLQRVLIDSWVDQLGPALTSE